MSTAAQIAANTINAQSSTGPRTNEGKSISAKNSVTHGLFSGDFIRPGEEPLYATLTASVLRDLAPVGALEGVLAEEIYRSIWRLRRCGEVEFRLVMRLNNGENFIQDPMEAPSPNCERIQHSVDRARSQAHRIIHKCTAELRKLQAERKAKAAESSEASTGAQSETLEATRTQSPAEQTPRNAPCPCGSSQKHKRCCGKAGRPTGLLPADTANDAPPVLQAA
jgi:hypothetical protein